MTGRQSLLTTTMFGAVLGLAGVSEGADFAPLSRTLSSTCQPLLEASQDAQNHPSLRKEKGEAALGCLSNLQSGVTTTITVEKNAATTAEEKLATLDSATALTSLIATKQKEATDATNAATTQSDFLGVSWGLGVGYAFGQGPRRVTAALVNNIVRISSDVTDGPRVFLEAHYYPEWWTSHTGNFGWGPFATVEAGTAGSTSSNGITGFGLGLMAGFKVPGTTSSSGFNVGVGYLWEGNVQTLGDGITANQALPSGETQIRYKNQSVGAVALLFSWKFGSSIPTSSSTPKPSGS
jgi:hypothetical protein